MDTYARVRTRAYVHKYILQWYFLQRLKKAPFESFTLFKKLFFHYPFVSWLQTCNFAPESQGETTETNPVNGTPKQFTGVRTRYLNYWNNC